MIYVSAGHHSEKRGACYEGFCEHEEAKVWVSLIANMLGFNAMVVPVGVLKDKVNFINERSVKNDIAIEIHFNSAIDGEGNHVGKGSETLYYPSSERGHRIAEVVQQELSLIFSPDRGVKEGYYQMNPNRGVDFFLARTVCTSLIIEPDFIHRRSIIERDREDGCNAIAEALKLVYRMDTSYEEGKRDGRISALERIVESHERELTELTKQMRYVERMFWMLIGAGVFIQVWPAIQKVL